MTLIILILQKNYKMLPMIKPKKPNITGAYFEYKLPSNTDPVKQVKKYPTVYCQKTSQHLTSGILKRTSSFSPTSLTFFFS